MYIRKLEPIKEMAEQMKKGKIKPSELLVRQNRSIDEKNRSINALVARNEKAMEQALQKDHDLQEERISGPFHGIPITIKDNISVAGMRATASHKPLADNIPQEDAIVVQRLKAAGAIVIGKTNLPEMAMDSQTDSPLFGRTNNPWNIEYTSGGSSGGSAAAVASGMSFLDVGNDLLGSVRIPAGYCGINCLVPTEHVIPHVGLVPERTMGSILGRMLRMGVLANNIDDLRLALDVLAGETSLEPDIAPVKLRGSGPEKKPEGEGRLRIAYTMDFGIPINNEVKKTIEAATEKIKSEGHTVEEVKGDLFCFNELSKHFLRFLMSALGLEMPVLIRWALCLLKGMKALDMSLARYLHAEGRRLEISRELELFFDSWDALICPVTATTAFKHMKPDTFFGPTPVYKKGIEMDGEKFEYAASTAGFTIPFSVTGNPVVVMPVGMSAAGLPISVQVVGKKWWDYKLLDVCERLEAALNPGAQH